jgi:hypothetical protein
MCITPCYLRLQKCPPVAWIGASICIVSQQYWPCHTRSPTVSITITLLIFNDTPPPLTSSPTAFPFSSSVYCAGISEQSMGARNRVRTGPACHASYIGWRNRYFGIGSWLLNISQIWALYLYIYQCMYFFKHSCY